MPSWTTRSLPFGQASTSKGVGLRQWHEATAAWFQAYSVLLGPLNRGIGRNSKGGQQGQVISGASPARAVSSTHVAKVCLTIPNAAVKGR